MYIEFKGDGLSGPARIGRVSFSKRGKTISFGGRRFQSLKGAGLKANYADVETGEQYSGSTTARSAGGDGDG